MYIVEWEKNEDLVQQNFQFRFHFRVMAVFVSHVFNATCYVMLHAQFWWLSLRNTSYKNDQAGFLIFAFNFWIIICKGNVSVAVFAAHVWCEWVWSWESHILFGDFIPQSVYRTPSPSRIPKKDQMVEQCFFFLCICSRFITPTCPWAPWWSALCMQP